MSNINNNKPCTQTISVDQDCLFLNYLDNCVERRLFPPLRLYQDDNFVYVYGKDGRQLSWAKDCPVIINENEYPPSNLDDAIAQLLVDMGCVNKSMSGGGGSFDDTNIVEALNIQNEILSRSCDNSPQNVNVCNINKEPLKYWIGANTIPFDEEFAEEFSITFINASGVDETRTTTTLQGEEVISVQDIVDQVNAAQDWVILSIPQDRSNFPIEVRGVDVLLCVEPSNTANSVDPKNIISYQLQFLNEEFTDNGSFYDGNNLIQLNHEELKRINNQVTQSNQEEQINTSYFRGGGSNTYSAPFKRFSVTALSADVTLNGVALPQDITVNLDSSKGQSHQTSQSVAGTDYFITFETKS